MVIRSTRRRWGRGRRVTIVPILLSRFDRALMLLIALFLNLDIFLWRFLFISDRSILRSSFIFVLLRCTDFAACWKLVVLRWVTASLMVCCVSTKFKFLLFLFRTLSDHRTRALVLGLSTKITISGLVIPTKFALAFRVFMELDLLIAWRFRKLSLFRWAFSSTAPCLDTWLWYGSCILWRFKWDEPSSTSSVFLIRCLSSLELLLL